MPDLFIKRIRKDEERKAPGIHDSIRCWRESAETKDASDDAVSHPEGLDTACRHAIKNVLFSALGKRAFHSIKHSVFCIVRCVLVP